MAGWPDWRAWICTGLAALAIWATACAQVAAAEEPERRFRIVTPADPLGARGFDNLRFGMTSFRDPAIAALFADRGAIAMGLDYHVGGGWALGLDTQTLFRDWGGASYFLSMTPIHAKFRVGVPYTGTAFQPFLTAGAGPTFLALLGDGAPKLGVGPGAAIGLGMMLEDALAVELVANVGRVNGMPYQGVQIRLGTAFGTLAGVSHRASRASQGHVERVHGDRLTVWLPPAFPAKPGDDYVVYVMDPLEIRVARARIEHITGGRATAVVLDATEPIKPGYLVRAW